MKKILCATTLAVVTTTAFGAASVRAPQLGGAATATPATAPATTARAGTMRAQTMKTSMSTSTATPTVTASIPEPVATETTDARLSFLKSVKGFNPGKVKDTTSAQQELNNINAQIEELQSKLDAAESAQATVLTESNIDDKITTNVESKTYTKSEIDNLFSAQEKKLPKIDDKGNMTWTDPNGDLVAVRIPKWQLIGEISDGLNQNFSEVYFIQLPVSQQSVEKIVQFTQNRCNNWPWFPDQHESFTCGATHIQYGNAETLGWGDFGEGYVFWVTNHFDGYSYTGNPEIIHQNGQIIYRQQVVTYEYSTLAALKTAACGEMSSDWCDVYNFHNLEDDGLGMQYGATLDHRLREGLSPSEIPTVNDRGNVTWTDPNGTLVSIPRYHFIPSGIYNEPLSTRYGFQTNAPDDKINEFVANFCHGQSEVWCSKESVNQSHSGGEPTLWILVREHGYASLSSWFSTLGSYTLYATNEDEPVAYVLDKICKDYSSEDCYAVGYTDQSDQPTVTPRYIVSIFKKLIPETELPAPLVE